MALLVYCKTAEYRHDESSYQGGKMGDHPLVWCHSLGAGRSFYTALGHSAEDYADPSFAQHLRGGIQWAAGGPAAP